ERPLSRRELRERAEAAARAEAGEQAPAPSLPFAPPAGPPPAQPRSAQPRSAPAAPVRSGPDPLPVREPAPAEPTSRRSRRALREAARPDDVPEQGPSARRGGEDTATDAPRAVPQVTPPA